MMTGKSYPKSPSVRANHRLVVLSGAIGGLIGLAMALILLRNGVPNDGPGALLTMPLPRWFAVLVALIWGIGMPIVSWRWERVVDEHERRAYRDGAVAGFYVMGIGAPVWWFLWRGGLAPAVDAVWLYGATMTVTGLVWLWRKHA